MTGRAIDNPLNNKTMKQKKLWYVITCHQKHEQTGEECSFLCRLTDSLEAAKKLMQSVYDDAEAGRCGRHGVKYTAPKWLNDNHTTLQVTADININGWLHSITTETYHLSNEWDSNIFDNKPWIID